MDDSRYPIGKFDATQEVTPEQVPELIAKLEHLPDLLAESVEGLSEEILDSSLRPGGWTVRQVVHHIADTHMNAYIRFRLALTEDSPAITPFNEALWAELDDAAHMPVDVSLKLLDALHKRWIRLIRSLDDAQLEAVYRHPVNGDVRLKKALQLFVWHSYHHMAQITEYRKQIGL